MGKHGSTQWESAPKMSCSERVERPPYHPWYEGSGNARILLPTHDVLYRIEVYLYYVQIKGSKPVLPSCYWCNVLQCGLPLMCIARRFKDHVFPLLLMCCTEGRISSRYIAWRVEVLCAEGQISLTYTTRRVKVRVSCSLVFRYVEGWIPLKYMARGSKDGGGVSHCGIAVGLRSLRRAWHCLIQL